MRESWFQKHPRERTSTRMRGWDFGIKKCGVSRIGERPHHKAPRIADVSSVATRAIPDARAGDAAAMQQRCRHMADVARTHVNVVIAQRAVLAESAAFHCTTLREISSYSSVCRGKGAEIGAWQPYCMKKLQGLRMAADVTACQALIPVPVACHRARNMVA